MAEAPDTSKEASDQGGTSSWTFLDGTRYESYAFPDGTLPAMYNSDGDKIGDWSNSDIWKAVSGDDDKLFLDLGLNFSEATYQNINFNFTEEEKNNVSWSYFIDKENSEEKNDPDKQATSYTVQGVSKPKSGTLWGEKAFSQRSKTLIYPEDHSSENFDFIKITPIEYVPAISQESSGFNTAQTPPKQATLDVGSDDWFGFKSLNSRYLRVKQVGSTMFLPMTPDISENNAVDWGGDKANALQAAAGKVAFDTIGRLGTAGDFQGVGQALVESGNQIGATATAFINNPQIGNFIKAYFAGKAVNANILGRAGIVVNPNLEVLFNGPALRTFAYNFRFTPRTESEATTVRTIIKVLKKTMAPKRRGKVFLTPPAVYRLKYIFNSEDDDHPFLNKIKPCALTGFNVQYAPDGNYMTYDDGSMTSYNVQMNFSELEPIYNDDIDDVDDRTTGF